MFTKDRVPVTALFTTEEARRVRNSSTKTTIVGDLQTSSEDGVPMPKASGHRPPRRARKRHPVRRSQVSSLRHCSLAFAQTLTLAHTSMIHNHE